MITTISVNTEEGFFILIRIIRKKTILLQQEYSDKEMIPSTF